MIADIPGAAHMTVKGLAYLLADTANLDGWRRFNTEILSAEAVPAVPAVPAASAGDDSGGAPDVGRLALRFDERPVRLLLRSAAEEGVPVPGWEVTDRDTAEVLLRQAGLGGVTGQSIEAAARGVEGFYLFADPAGNLAELCWGPKSADQPFRGGSRPHAGFRTGELGLGHVVWSMADIGPAAGFYRDVLGFRPSDHATVPGRMEFFHVNPRHHSLALGELGFEGLHHLMVEVLELDDLGRAYDAALDGDWEIITRLGRHSNDHVTSFYVRTPSGWAIEVGWGGLLITDEDAWQVRALTEGPSLWGHERTWVGPEMQQRQRVLRAAAAAANLRAPLHVPAGIPMDVNGVPLG
ncbi:MAG: VOC family protein [Acidimicrobiales bacterium]